ncbi:MAG: LLM class flavin-dependent oxidoreductase [Actinobacteria bacterium]|nr:LLM class flavin-dependent oxidoreductase [Actinomycetota bacterium]
MNRAFGITATEDRKAAEAVALAAEEAGYSAIWTNDGVADGVATASWMAGVTDRIGVGIGVVACDRMPAADLAEKVKTVALPLDRCVVGIGSGFSSNPIEDVRAAVGVLRSTFGDDMTIAVAAMGPRMCRLAGEISDVVLLNWMTPQRIAWARGRISDSAKGRTSEPRVASYVRVATGAGAAGRISAEASRYASIPHYASHFSAMGKRPGEVGIAGDSGELETSLKEYEEVLDELVVRGVPASGDVQSTLEIVRAASGR